MAFFKKNNNGYSVELATDLLGDTNIYLVGLHVETQRVYDNDKVTEEISGYQVWVATEDNNPFKVKFDVTNKPSLDNFKIGDVINFENLQAIDIRNKIYFKASKIIKK